MPQSNQMGMNRTGMDMAPLLGKAMIKGSKLASVGPVRYDGIETIRRAYTGPDESMGSVPMPGRVRGVLSAGKEKLQGFNPQVLINKLGQRLAFERAGVRLYDALIFKCEAVPEDPGAQIVMIDKLRQFRNEEKEHFLMVKKAMEDIGADPTAMTPDADVSALASLGIQKVLTEPRTSILQCMEAIQTAELTDNAAWGLLQELCSNMGLDEMAQDFGHALAQEEVHADVISKWLRLMVMDRSGAEEPVHH